MAVVSKQFTFTTGATIIAAEHNTNFDDIYNQFNGNIDNDNIKSTAGIVDTKLAQINTASKVSGAALTSLGSVPTGGGELPSLNAGVPTGSITAYATTTTPSGWVLCDGETYDASSDSSFQDLFDVIGNVFGGADNTDFQTPDLRGRFMLGLDNMGGTAANLVTAAEADSLGSSSGAEFVPSHTHSNGSYAAAVHAHVQNSGVSDVGGGGIIIGATTDGGSPMHAPGGGGAVPRMESGVVAGGGGGVTGTSGDTTGSNSIMNPFISMSYIIKK